MFQYLVFFLIIYVTACMYAHNVFSCDFQKHKQNRVSAETSSMGICRGKEKGSSASSGAACV